MKPQRSKFYLYMSWLLMCIIVLGFGPTFLLRPFVQLSTVGPSHLDGWVIAHAMTGFTWMTLFIVQTTLVHKKNVKLHKQLGWLGLGLGILMVFSIFMALLNIPGRWMAEGKTKEDIYDLLGLVFMFNVIGALVFGIFVVLGVIYRRNLLWHRTFMIYAGIAVVAEAFPRLSFHVFRWSTTGPEGAILYILLGLSPLIYEIWHKRVQKLTVGVAISITLLFVGSFAFGLSPLGKKISWMFIEFWTEY